MYPPLWTSLLVALHDDIKNVSNSGKILECDFLRQIVSQNLQHKNLGFSSSSLR